VAALGAIGAAAAVPTLAEALADREPAVQLTAAFALGRIGPAAKEAHAALVKAQAQPDPVLQVVATWALIKSGAGDAAWKDKAIAWLAQKLMSSDAIVRTAAFRALAELRPGPQRVLPTIERVLQGADKHAAAEALSALAGLGEPAVPALVKALKLPEHRSAVVSILAHIGPPAKAAIPELLAVARDDKKASVRRDALLALGAIGADPAQAVPAALAALKDRSDRVQYAACSLLGKLGAAAAAAEPELRKLLDHQDEVLPMAAAWALVKINPTNAELAPKLVPLLIKALDQHDPLARCAAATALGELGPLAKDAAEPLKKKAAGDPDEHVRNLAAAAAAKVEKTP
jgi:HEAT repeat protein